MTGDLTRRGFTEATIAALGLASLANANAAPANASVPASGAMPRAALLLIDVQNDYFPGGRFPLVGMEAAAQNCANLLEFCRGKGLPLVHVRHEELSAGATFFLPGSEGAKINPVVAPATGETVVLKHFPNAFRETALKEILDREKIDSLVIVGAMTLMCVDATARAAFDFGYRCTVVHDACAARALDFNGMKIPAPHVHGAFLAALAMGYAEVKSTREVLLAMSDDRNR